METKFEYDIEMRNASGEWVSCGLTITDYGVAMAQFNSYMKHQPMLEFRLRHRKIIIGDWEACGLRP